MYNSNTVGENTVTYYYYYELLTMPSYIEYKVTIKTNNQTI